MTLIDLDSREAALGADGPRYRTAAPFPHIVLEEFLGSDTIAAAMTEFPELDAHQWNNYIHANERKFSNTDPDTWGPTLQGLLAELNSPRFIRYVSDLTGIDDLMPDPSLEGGGLHASTRGGFLNMHADFTVHPRHRDWRRRVNLLLYLNEDWRPEYGGDLELWSTDMKRCEERIAPVGNRVVIFTTDVDSFHGHPEPMLCPEGTFRRSLALYYFTKEEEPVVRSTEYRARPGDGAKSVSIYLDKQLLRTFDWSKRHLGLSDKTASRLLGVFERTRRKHPPG